MRPAALVLLLAAGCAPDAPPPTPTAPAAPKLPDLPPLPDLAAITFRDWADVDPAADAIPLALPAGAEALAWRFEEGRRFGYDYGETLTQKIHRRLGEREEAHVSREKNRGTFEFAGGKDKTALCRVRIQTSELHVDGRPAPRPPHEDNPTSGSDAVVAADGTPDLKQAGGRADARFYLLTLLALRPGERPLQHGQVKTRIAGARKVGPWDCVRIESEFESAIEDRRERQVFKGRAVGYFAPAPGRFVLAAAKVSTSSRKLELTRDRSAWVVTSLDALSESRVTLLD